MLKSNTKMCNYNRGNHDGLFFSLVDYRNNYLFSDRIEEVLDFYSGFDNRESLIRWMHSRPKGVHRICEVEGEKEIIVVIPTADYDGSYAKECRENIFKGLHIIFVESGKYPDPYFNYAHNCNVGINKALEYKPKWVIVSNDDMYKVDDVTKLKAQLLKIPEIYDVVFITEGKYHSRLTQISNQTLRRKIILNLMGKYEKARLKLENKFRVALTIGTTYDIKRFLYKPIKKIRYTGSFSIFSYNFIRRNENKVFDEIYINGMEDIDLSLRIHGNGSKLTEIDYSIGDMVGGTIGPYTSIRRIRGLVNDCYFNSKFGNDIMSITKF